MTTTSKILMIVLVAAVMVISIGYAVVTNQDLNVVATATGEAAQSDFKVCYTGDGQVSQNSKGSVTATKINDHNAIFTVTGLKLAGDTASATYTVQNLSDGIDVGSILAEVQTASNEYFSITTTQPTPQTLAKGQTATFTVTATLLKTALTQQNFTTGVTITASPVSGTYIPGNTGGSTGGNESSNPTVAITDVQLNKTEMGLIKGVSTVLTPTISPQGATETLSWESTNPSVATVTNGTIQTVGNGSTVIKCYAEDNPEVFAECSIEVQDCSNVYAQIDETTPSYYDLEFINIPKNFNLNIWIDEGAESIDSSVINRDPSHTKTKDNNIIEHSNLAINSIKAQVYYRLEDTLGNLSEVYHFYSADLSCFTADTLVETKNGMKKIQDIKVGDIVLSINEETMGIEEKEVKRLFISNVDYDLCKIYIEDNYIECTTGHEIYTKNKGWIKAVLIEKGDILIDSNNEEVIVTNAECCSQENKVTVYNFEVEDNHNYFVGKNRVLVHNALDYPGVSCDTSYNNFPHKFEATLLQ